MADLGNVGYISTAVLSDSVLAGDLMEWMAGGYLVSVSSGTAIVGKGRVRIGGVVYWLW